MSKETTFFKFKKRHQNKQEGEKTKMKPERCGRKGNLMTNKCIRLQFSISVEFQIDINLKSTDLYPDFIITTR